MPKVERSEKSSPKEQQLQTKLGIIDDSDSLVRNMALSFELNGLELVRIANNLADALEAIPSLEEKGIQIVIVDGNLTPGRDDNQDGERIVFEIKRLLPDIKTISFTASEKGVQGTDCQVRKGTGVQRLLDQVDDVIAKLKEEAK